MPWIKITEVDDTGRQYDGTETVVFVPGDIDVPSKDSNSCLLLVPSSGLDPIPENMPDELKIGDEEESPAPIKLYIDALLRAGLQVLYHYVGVGKTIGCDTSLSLDFLKDKNEYNVKFLTAGPKLMFQSFEGSAGQSDYNCKYKLTIASTQPNLITDIELTLTGYDPTATSNYLTWTESYSGQSISFTNVSFTYNEVEGTTTLSVTIPPKSIYYEASTGTTLTLEKSDDQWSASIGGDADSIEVIQQFLEEDALSTDISSELFNSLSGIAYERGDCSVIASIAVDDTVTQESIKTSLDGKDLNNQGKYGYGICSKVVKDNVYTYPDLAYLVTFGQAIKDNSIWEALANSSRGTVRYHLEKETKYFPEDSTISKYQLDNNIMDTTGHSFNGLIKLRGQEEPVIWGDRTLLKNADVGNLKATSFMSIRNMISDIAKRCYYSAIRETFETNNDITWTNFKGMITDLLDEMVADYKLANYQIFKLPSGRAEIKCEIHIAPYGPVEDFDITIRLTNIDAEVAA